METDCHKRSVDRYIKVKKGHILLYGLVKVSAIPFWLLDDRFYRYVGVNFTFGLLDCDRYIRISLYCGSLNRGFVTYINYTVTLAGLKNVNRYIGNIVFLKIVISGFRCSTGMDKEEWQPATEWAPSSLCPEMHATTKMANLTKFRHPC